MKMFALSLAFMVRFSATWKWPIVHVQELLSCAVLYGIEYLQFRNIDVFSEDNFWIDVACVILPLHQLESPGGILSTNKVVQANLDMTPGSALLLID